MCLTTYFPLDIVAELDALPHFSWQECAVLGRINIVTISSCQVTFRYLCSEGDNLKYLLADCVARNIVVITNEETALRENIYAGS